MHFNKTSKLVNFCIAILILKMEENKWRFWHIMLYYFKKGKNTTETHKKDFCNIRRRSCDWPNVSEVVCEVSCWISCWTMLHGRVDQLRLKAIKLRHWKQSTFYHVGDSQHTQNIQINKVIGENEKCVFYFTEKSIHIFGQPNTFRAVLGEKD